MSGRRSIRVLEYGRIPRAALGPHAAQLQALDERYAARHGETIFDWSLRCDVRARNHVGVLQVGELTVEVLPKIDRIDGDQGGALDAGSAQRNLLHMLAVAGRLPNRQRETSSLRTPQAPLIDAFVAAFAEALLEELRLGLHHRYVVTEENRHYFRGKLLLAQHLRVNAFHRERCYSECDEFVADTPLNQLLKATCRFLLQRVRQAWPERCLREALLELDAASDQPLSATLLGRVHLDRSSERFADLVGFCRLVVEGVSPHPSGGGSRSFSLLFPMDRLFESFIGRFVQQNAARLGLEGCRVHLQAAGRRRWLLRRESGQGQGAFRLKPDLLIERDERPVLILDTKWKKLSAESAPGVPAGDAGNVSPADVYQLHAYLARYDCADAVLLCPRWHGSSRHTFVLDGDSTRRIRIEPVNVSGDLGAAHGRRDLLNELRLILAGDPAPR